MNDTNEKPSKLIAIYARVSTSRQENEGTIETQLSVLREYAQKNSLIIVKEYLDDGWSGDILARPSLDELRQDAKSKLWEAVLFYDPDRLARRYSYQELVMDELREAGVEVMFITISAPKNSEDKILHGVRGLFAEYERTKIAERFRLGKLRSIKEGHIIASRPLYGYSRVPRNGNDHGYYVINEEEAVVVRKMFSWVADEGLNIRQVVRRLQELHIPPKQSKRGVWSTSTLTTLLRNEAFIGKAHWYSSVAVEPKNPLNKEKYRKVKKSSSKKRPKSEWMYVPVPPIIGEDLFNRARAQLAKNAQLNPRSKKYEYLLGGRTYCTCGQKRTGAARNLGRNLYYDCCEKILCFPLPRQCHENPINARIADELVWQKISALMSSPELLTKQIERWMNKKRTRAQSTVADIPTIEKEIEKLKNQQERYNKAYGAGLFSIEQLNGYVTPIREKVLALETEMKSTKESAEKISGNALPSESEIKAFVRKATLALQDLKFEQKRAIVLNTVEKIVGTQQQLQVYGYIPLISHGWYETNNRYCGSAKRRKIDAF